MADPGYPVDVIGGVPVVAAPEEIDAATAESFRKILLHAACRGPATVVVNMTATRFCDSSGVNALVWVRKRAVDHGGELLLVIPASIAVRRVLSITGIDLCIRTFAGLNEALEQARAPGASAEDR
jgi:anti-sigma B factor antagonist